MVPMWLGYGLELTLEEGKGRIYHPPLGQLAVQFFGVWFERENSVCTHFLVMKF